MRILPALLAAACLWSCASPLVAQERDDDSTPSAVVFVDRYGIPHIDAPDPATAYYALGYLHGRDRRFQLEMLRLTATGRLREMFGSRDEILTKLDVQGRMLDFKGAGLAMAAASSPREQEWMQAYADGINAATTREKPPMEFGLVGWKPEPWTPADSAAIMAMVSFGLCKNWHLEIGRLELMLHQLRTGGTIERALRIWPPRYDLPPHMIGRRPPKDPFADVPAVAPELAAFLVEWARRVGPPRAAGSPHHERSGPAWGKSGGRSNNWALSGAWTGTGKGALSSDPHMPLSLPPLGYLAHLRCREPAFAVVGGGFPGMPVIAFGTNGKVAWGVTANWGDVTDLYVEKPAPGDPDEYLYRGRAEPFAVREEVFKIRQEDGSHRIERRRVRSSRHGVLLNDFVARLGPDFPPVALAWSRRDDLSMEAVLRLYRSRSVAEAEQAVVGMAAVVGHYVLADDTGHIGYLQPMPLPRREGFLGTVPVPGWTGGYEWRGLIPQERIPSLFDPPSGFLATANQQTVQPESTGFPLNFEGDIHHRYLRISRVLGAGRGDRSPVEASRALELDGVDLGWEQLRPVFGPALERLADGKNAVARAARTLLDWDGECRPRDVGPTLFHSLCAMLIHRLLEDEMPPATVEFVLEHFNIEPFVYGLLAVPENPAWDDRRTPARETAGDVVAAVFAETVGALERRYGSRQERWWWRRAAPLVYEHPFGRIAALAPLVNRGPFPTRGAGNTVFKHQFMRNELTRFPVRYGPVLRVNVDLADLEGSMMSVPGGQSGRPGSPHYDDLLPLYLEGRGASMRMDFEAIAKDAVERLVIRR